jgi:uncharacterized protein (TIGR01319 family)
MLVSGVIKNMTAESAERAALGAGAIVNDVVSLDDERLVIERINRIRESRPDIILLSGGTDGADISHVAALAEAIAAAAPQPRFGATDRIPVVYAGNRRAREYVTDVLSETMDVRVVDNLRPSLDVEVLEPARHEIQQLFLDHVMLRAPGYRRLVDWTERVMMPTPMAFGDLIKLLAERWERDILAVDIGGATTDVFSVLDGRFTRTVSANIGMSYSLGNVLAEAGIASIRRWLPFAVDERALRNWNFNKAIRPTGLPGSDRQLLLEQAQAREALRLSLTDHRRLLGGLLGVQRRRGFTDVFNQTGADDDRCDPALATVLIGGGGVLSHAPRRAQAMLMMIDGLTPSGVTQIYVDAGSCLSHLGAMAGVAPDVAVRIAERDCLIPLGCCVAPFGSGRSGVSLAALTLERDDGTSEQAEIMPGEMAALPLPAGAGGTLYIKPGAGWDCGAGRGKSRKLRVVGGECGIVLDGRGRPISTPADEESARAVSGRWATAVGALTAAELAAVQQGVDA